MDSLPTGSKKILEIQSGNVCVVIKSKNFHPNLINKSILKQPSELRVAGADISSVKIFGEEKIVTGDGAISVSNYRLCTAPLFFEQTDYEVIIQSTNGQVVSAHHENYSVRERMGAVTNKGDLVTGIINFGNSAGFSEFEISCDGKECLTLNIEVFPSKISYKEDYQAMLQDISDEVSSVVLDFLRNTYQELDIDPNEPSTPAMFYVIIKHIFDKFKSATNMIISSPHHKLSVEHPIVPAHKVKRTDNYTLKWLQKHPENVVVTERGYAAIKAPTVKKQITYNTTENQFTKFILKSTINRLKDFKERYMHSTAKTEQDVLDRVDGMIRDINKHINTSFLKDVDDYKATQSMSLVFGMAPGYRELYKYYIMLQKGLSVNGDVFRMSLKDTAELYEYWCFIKLVCLLKRRYKLDSSDVIKVDDTGVTINLVKGQNSEVAFLTEHGDRITLSYNPGYQKTQTVNQKPDNVLSLEKKGSDVEYKYVFDAKYRIENNPSGDFYPDDKPGPKVDDINTMHRYRDAIVYENENPSRFLFEKTMFGAYVLFPYDDSDDYANGVHVQGNGSGKKEVVGHKFYNSIETVNIGGLPFLPGTTDLVEKFLTELIADSPDSAFERASLPRGIDERLAKVDWSVRDVLVSSIDSNEQLGFCLQKRGYYIPASCVSDAQLPIRYVALCEDDAVDGLCIRRYGEVLRVREVSREEISVSLADGEFASELYYYFTVREWKELPRVLAVPDAFAGRVRFTNKFLLDHCDDAYQLFTIASEEDYRMKTELRRAYSGVVSDLGEDDALVHHIEERQRLVVKKDAFFTITDENGEVIDMIRVDDFGRRPRAEFEKVKDAME